MKIIVICAQNLNNIRGATRAYNMYKSFQKIGVKVYYYDSWRPSIRFSFFNIFMHLKLICRLFLSDSKTYVFLENIQEPYLLRLISKFKKKLVVDIRDDRELHAKSMGIDINQRQKCMLDYYLVENFEFANKIICSSSSLVNHYNLKFKNRYKDKMFSIINASDTDHFVNNKTNSNFFRVGFIGGLNQNSGINMLIDACVLANSIIPNLKLDIAYNTISKTEKFEEEVLVKSKIHKFIKLRTTIFYETAPFFFNNIDVLAIPLLDTKMNQMRTSNKLFDAMASGTPVIITDVEEQRKLVKKWNIGLIADFNAVSLSKKIIKIFEDKKLYNDFSVNSRKLAEDEHNWDFRVNLIKNRINEI